MPSSPSPSHARLLVRLLRVAWEQRVRCLLVLGLQLLLLGSSVLALGLTGAALDVIHGALSPQAASPRWPWGIRPPTDASPLMVVLAVAGVIVAIALFRTWLQFVHAVAVADVVQGRIVPSIRARLYEKLSMLSFRFYDRHESGSLLNRITSDVQYLRSFVDGVLIQSLVVLLALAVYGSYMFTMHAGLTLACLASSPLIWAVTVRFSRRVLPEHANMRAQMDHFVLGVSESVQGAHVIKGFAAEPTFEAELLAKNQRVRDGQRRIFRQMSRFSATIDVLTHLNVATLLAYGGLSVVRGTLSVGELVVFAGLLQQFSTHVTTMSTIVNTLQESLIGARRVFEVLDTETEVVSPARPTPHEHFVGHVRFERVCFGYGERPSLTQIDLEAQPGECIALFGAAGAGKSTLLSLIPRFYDVESGRVLVDGIDVRELSLASLRKHTAFVFQETFLFSNTIAANIAFGHPQASPAQIEQAARLARAHDFIVALPHGYDTLLGELATNLSGGQRQRIAIARALLSDPRILLLDDPTAALDAETTREFLETLETAARGRTTFIATHRPQLLERVDRILVLEQGRVVQHGSHAELLRRDGPYRRAIELALPALEERAS